MPFIIESDDTGSDFEPIPVGNHAARCIGMFDIGHHYDKNFDNWKHQLILMFEVPEHTIEFDGQQRPMTISKFYTRSLGRKANLHKDLVNWRGKAFTDDEIARFDLETILGHACLLSVIHTDAGKHRISGISGLVKGMQVPVAQHELRSYDMRIDTDGSAYKQLPEWIQKQVDKSRERQQTEQSGGFQDSNPNQEAQLVTAEVVEDDTPF